MAENSKSHKEQVSDKEQSNKQQPTDPDAIFKAISDQLMNEFNETCKDEKIIAGVTIMLHKDFPNKPIIATSGHEFNCASLTAYLLRMLKKDLLPQLEA